MLRLQALVGNVGEVGQMAVDQKGGAGTTAYTATLARNACHFAPESWHSWEDHHHKALALARESHAAAAQGDAQTQAAKLNEALLVNGFGDHYLQDSYAAEHLMNKTKIMQMYVRYLDKNPRWNAGYTTPASWRAFQSMAYNQEGLTDRGQYDKAQVKRRDIGGQQVSTARNPQAVENTQSLANFSWQNRFAMLGLKVPTAAQPGTPAWKVLVYMQQQRGGFFGNRYNVDFKLGDLEAKATTIGVSRAQVGPAVTSLLDANIIYDTSQTRAEAGARLAGGAQGIGTFTLRKEWVVSVTGGNERKSNDATVGAATAGAGANAGYDKMAQATVYREYTLFMKDAFLQKSTNAAHDYFCVNGLQVRRMRANPSSRSTGTPTCSMRRARSGSGSRALRPTCHGTRSWPRPRPAPNRWREARPRSSTACRVR